MKFCYCDESGTGEEPYGVMVGTIVDAQRMHKTKQDWAELLVRLSRIVGKKIEELHTRDFYPGSGIWYQIKGKERTEIISEVLSWLYERKHDVIFTVIDKKVFNQELAIDKIPTEIKNIWCALAFHIILGIQKYHQTKDKNKGHTVLIFDNEECEMKNASKLVIDTPPWSDSFYNKHKKSQRLDQIIDVPYWGDSKEVGLIQLSDFLAFFIRRYVEIKTNARTQKYEGEDAKLDEWFTQIKSRTIAGSVMYPKRGRCEIAEMYWNLCPDIVRAQL